jgi:peroxiredoxin
MTVVAIVLPWLLIGFGGWLFVQFLRQNGRLLLRLESLEEQLEWITEALAAEESQHAIRNGKRTLAESKINREGLPIGTPAPEFRLPRLDGGELSLSDYRGKKVLLIFSDPHCGPCVALAPDLEKAHRQHPEVQVLMISRGEAAENREKVRQHRLTFPVVLQKRWEISKLYALFATPIGYLIDEEGRTASEVAVGADAILAQLSGAASAPEPKEVMLVS